MMPRRNFCKGLSTSVIVTGIKGTGDQRAKRKSENEKPPPRPIRRNLRKTVPRVDIRDKVYLDFLSKLRQSNGVKLGDFGLRYFRFYIGSGNNSKLVKRVVKKRWWWIASDSIKDAQFIWTSVKKAKAFRCLPATNNSKIEITEQYDSEIPKN